MMKKLQPISRITLFWLFWLLLIQTAPAQLPASLSDVAQISLLTISPGDALYSTFGHSAIRIVDPKHRLDRIYNYGTFSFEEPGFYLKFARGKLDYQLSAYPYRYAEMEYKSERRSVIEQVFRLTPAMKNAIYRFLEINYLPENRRYRYDFFFDNCATRIRDVFEKVLDDSLRLYLNTGRQLTFRQYLDIYLVSHPFSDFGIDLGLGARADRVATPRQAMFLPDFLYESFDQASIRIGGQWQPLVAKRDTLLWYDEPQRMEKAFPLPAVIFWTLLLLMAVLTVTEYRAIPWVTKLLRWMDGLIFSLVGLLGVVIALLWFATDHKVTPDNWNLLWALPTHLMVGIVVLLDKKPAWIRWYYLLTTAITVFILVGWQWIPQEFHPAIIPIILLLGGRALWRYRQTRVSRTPPA